MTASHLVGEVKGSPIKTASLCLGLANVFHLKVHHQRFFSSYLQLQACVCSSVTMFTVSRMSLLFGFRSSTLIFLVDSSGIPLTDK